MSTATMQRTNSPEADIGVVVPPPAAQRWHGNAFLSFGLTFAGVALWSFLYGTVNTYYDSNGYWAADGLLGPDGGFSLAAWPSQMRGYLMPTIAYASNGLADLLGMPRDSTMKLSVAAAFAWCAAVAGPAFYEAVTRRRVTLLQRGAFIGLVVLFWYGWALWPLTDFVSLAAAMHGAALLLRIDARAAMWRVAPLAAVSGFLLAFATNARPVYSVVFYAAVAAVFVAAAWTRRVRRSIVVLAAFTLGALVVHGPQMYVNHAHDRPLNPFRFIHDQGTDLYLVTLDNGFRFPKYETNVGDPDFVLGGVGARDALGESLWHEFRADCCADGSSFTHRQYVEFVATHPVEMGTVYARHVMNGLDIWWTFPYLEQVTPVPAWRRVVNYAIWFTVFVTLVSLARHAASHRFAGIRQQRAGAVVAVLAVLGLPTLLVVPGGVETRYYLPAFFFAYGLVAFVALPRLLVRNWWSWRRAWLLPALVVFCVIWLMDSDIVIGRMAN